MSEGQGGQWTGQQGTFGRYHLPGGITVGYCTRHKQAWQVRDKVDSGGCVACDGERRSRQANTRNNRLKVGPHEFIAGEERGLIKPGVPQFACAECAEPKMHPIRSQHARPTSDKVAPHQFKDDHGGRCAICYEPEIHVIHSRRSTSAVFTSSTIELVPHTFVKSFNDDDDLCAITLCKKPKDHSIHGSERSEPQLHFHRTVPHQGPALSPILRDILAKRYVLHETVPGCNKTTLRGGCDRIYLEALRDAGVPDVEILLGIIEQDGEVAISVK